MGTQSAKLMKRGTPGADVMSASALVDCGSVRPLMAMVRMPCICETRVVLADPRPTAIKARRLFSLTFSNLSPALVLIFKLLYGDGLTPPVRSNTACVSLSMGKLSKVLMFTSLRVSICIYQSLPSVPQLSSTMSFSYS